MATTQPPDTAAEAAREEQELLAESTDQLPEVPPEEAPEPVAQVPTLRLAIVVACPVLAAAVMTGGVFLGPAARVWAAITGLLGVALAARASRLRRPGLLYAAIVGGVFAIGLLAVLPTGFGNVVNVGREMRAALVQADILRPPVEFLPGWRAILGWLMAALGFSSAWLAIELRRPALGLIVSLPVVGIGAISLPEAEQLWSGMGALVLFVIGLGLLSGSQTTGEDDQPVTLAYEARRAVRALPMIAIVTVALYFGAQSDWLFPPPLYDPAQEARLPETVPLSEVEDRILFTVEAGFTGPWKMGSLDVYDGEDWRLPPFADSELNEVPETGLVNTELRPGVRASFAVHGLGGAILPGLPNTVGIVAEGPQLSYDGRTGNIRLSQGQIEPGFQYIVAAAEIPNVDVLRRVEMDIPNEIEQFLEVPDPPRAVNDLLRENPGENAWDRLDFMRKTLLRTVVASGAGNPVSVRPEKVQDMLEGSNVGTPFEIVAGQAMIARWVGIPARIGYGFDGGDEGTGGMLEIRPKHGAAWLEVFFPGNGWLPVIGDPLQAQESFSDAPQQFNPQVLTGDDVSVQLFVPVRVEPGGELLEEARDFFKRVVPIVLALLFVYYLWPLPYKAFRRARRRTWASDRGPRARIALAYSEWRDHGTDFGYRYYTDTPLMFLDRVVPDEEHAELAWLATRVLWGDLQDETTEEDALAAEELSRSLRRRLSSAHSATLRFVAALSRLSVRHPYAPDLDALARGAREEAKERVAA